MDYYTGRIMIRISKTFRVFISLFLICVSCTKDDFPNDPLNSAFAIYLLKDQEIKIEDILSIELVSRDSITLASIEIQQYPWLTNDEIEMYDFSSHILYLKFSNRLFLPDPVKSLFPSEWLNKPFMVIADGMRRYIGVFKGFAYADEWPVPYIIDFYNYYYYPDDLLFITWPWFNRSETDNRNDEKVREALHNAGILHEGLNLKLKNVDITQNSDTATIEYTYTIVNKDVDNLYIIDPDKMGADLFHYYNRGPQFLKSDETSVRFASLTGNQLSIDSWDSAWFTKVSSGDSITRTLNLRGFPIFQTGQYCCELSFDNIIVPKTQRTLSDGRYWIGPTKSNSITIQY